MVPINSAKDGALIVLPKNATIKITSTLKVDISDKSLTIDLNGSTLKQGASCETLIECTKRPGGRRCLGLLQVVKTEDDSLYAYCPECGTEHLLVSNWQTTRWAAQKSHWVT